MSEPSSLTASLQVTLVSPTCFASGSGGLAGGIDTEVEYDTKTGLPFVRGRSIKGLLIEEVALVLRALEPDGEGPLHDAAARLFGEPGRDANANLRIGDGTLPSDVVAIATDRCEKKRWHPTDVRDALTCARSQTRVDGESGAPETGSLRTTRLLIDGLTFSLPLSFREPPSPLERALLACAAASVRRAGLHRHRGWGKVRVRVLNDEGRDRTSDWAALLLSSNDDDAMRTANVQGPSREPSNKSSPEGRHVVTYRLTLEAPLVLSTSGGDPNTTETLPFVSGAAILGALAGRFLRGRRIEDAASGASPEGALFRALFLTGETRFLHAYPAGSAHQRLLPIPRSFAKQKGQDGGFFSVWDRAAPQHQGAEPPDDLQSWSGPLLHIDTSDGATTIEHRAPAQSVRMHHTRDRERGRPTEKGGAIFAHVSIDEGERFVGHVLCEDGRTAAIAKALLEQGPLSLGRSRAASYGGVARVDRVAVEAAATFQEAPSASVVTKGRIVFTLLSDALGVDDAGNPSPEAICQEIERATGLSRAGLQRACSFLAGRPVSGYVSQWRMPRPIHPALAAGSVLVYEGVVEQQRIEDLLWRGLGARRAEGFGRVAVDLHGHEPTMEARRTEPERRAPPPPSSQESDTLGSLKRAMVTRHLVSHLVQGAEREVRNIQSLSLSPSLIARLRGRIRTARGSKDIITFLNDIKGNQKPAAKSFARVKRGGETPLVDWLIELLGDREGVPAWRPMLDAKSVENKVGVPLSALDTDDDFRLLQCFLDAYCEALRRKAQHGRANPSRAGGAP